MRLASVRRGDQELPALIHPVRGLALAREVDPAWSGDLLAIIRSVPTDDLRAGLEAAPDEAFADPAGEEFGPPYRHPRMLWGIGLNYVEHAGDLSEGVPEEPASFIKGDHTVIGPGETIPVPPQSVRTTAEAELGLVIGRECRDVEPEDAMDHVLGVVPVLDQTAEDILERNPRFLTRAKNFPGFFAFGPVIAPLTDVVEVAGSLPEVEVATVHNGGVHRRNTVRHMRYDPAYLVSFHSKVMPLQPGDVISTGTPGAVHVRSGDVVECRIPGLPTLVNPVADAAR